MVDLTNITSVIKGIEGFIEERFGSQAGYRQVKDVLEGKAEKVDTRSLVIESRAAFSGNNRPEALALDIIDGLRTDVEAGKAEIPGLLKEREKAITDRIEKNKATMESRPSNVEYEVAEEEAVFTGRLVAADGTSPVAGAKVLVRGTGREAETIVMTAVTDENGEYVIKMDAAMVKEAPKKLAVAFESPKGEAIAESSPVLLSATKGKTKVVPMVTPEEKKETVAGLVMKEEERTAAASIEMAELKKGEAELAALRFQADKSVKTVEAGLDALKDLFVKKTP